jgi:hypothetical protein
MQGVGIKGFPCDKRGNMRIHLKGEMYNGGQHSLHGGGGVMGFSQFVHSSSGQTNDDLFGTNYESPTTGGRDPDQGVPFGSGACLRNAFLLISWMERVRWVFL